MSPGLFAGGVIAIAASYVVLRLGRRRNVGTHWLALLIVALFVIGLAMAIKALAG